MIEHPVRTCLKKQYRQLLGELVALEATPKPRALRLIRERDAYEAGAPARQSRIAEIKEALPHIAFVLKMYDPEWSEAQAQPIRPKAAARTPGMTISGAALDVLRNADRPLLVREIVAEIAERRSVEIGSVEESQRYYQAVRACLVGRAYRDVIREHDTKPKRYSLRSD